MRSRAVAYITLTHFTPLATVVAVTGLLAWMIAGSSLSLWELSRMMLAMLGGQIVVGVVNELVDAENDGLTKSSKPIPAGEATQRGAMTLGVAGLVLMIVAGVSLGAASFLILLAGTGTGVAYSLWFKRSRFAWLPYLVRAAASADMGCCDAWTVRASVTAALSARRVGSSRRASSPVGSRYPGRSCRRDR